MAKSDNLFLVGLMGAGKTTMGRLLAQALSLDFIDSDREIEERMGVSIPTIFEIEGEQGFRRREASIIAELSERKDQVLATGGGSILLPENRATLMARGFVIYLQAAPEILWERTRHSAHRPLLKVPDPLNKLRTLFEERDPLYRAVADLVIEGNNGSTSASAQLLTEEVRKQWKR